MWVMISAASVRVIPFFLASRRWKVREESVIRQEVVPAPYFAEKDVVVEVGELGGEVAEGVAPGGLNYLLLCHNGCR